MVYYTPRNYKILVIKQQKKCSHFATANQGGQKNRIEKNGCGSFSHSFLLVIWKPILLSNQLHKKPHPNYILFQGFYVEWMRTTLACDTLIPSCQTKVVEGLKLRSIACMPAIDFSNPWSQYSSCSNFTIDRSFIQSSWLLQKSHAIGHFFFVFLNFLFHES